MLTPLFAKEFKTPQQRKEEIKKELSEKRHKATCEKNRLKRKNKKK